MITQTFSLDAINNGGNVTAFTYSHGLNELCGAWSAIIANGTFMAGDTISFAPVMTNGIISRAQKDSSGLWHIEGYDAGIRLMRSTPDINDMPTGDTKKVIQFLAGFCGISLIMSGSGLSDFNVRSLVSASTCAEAILELAMFSGLIVFIGNDGNLHVQNPAPKGSPALGQLVINDSGSDFDLDGYATQVTVVLRKSSLNDDEEDTSEANVYYTGSTPSSSPHRNTLSGSFDDGEYSITMLEPFGVAERVFTRITENDITIETEENHIYTYKHKTIWRDKQEYVLFAFIETGYTIKKTTTGSYGGDLFFSETTTETLSRELSLSDAVGVPEDWMGDINMVGSENITRSTLREGGKAVNENMPDYSPPFDSQIERKYFRERRGKGLLCKETEKRYEARQVGTISPIKVDGEPVPHFMLQSNLAIQTHSTPQWVEIDTYRTYYEKYDDEGNCVLSTRSEYCDDGSKWLTENALSDSGDEDTDEYQKSYAKFSQVSSGLDVSLGSSVITSAWHFVELPGRRKNYKQKQGKNNEDDITLDNIEEWYSNGAYLPSNVCPHYNSSAEICNVSALDNEAESEEGTTNNDCFRRKGKYHWMDCSRAVQALEIAREKEKKHIDAPIIKTASLSGTTSKSPTVGYKREIYINDELNEEEAGEIADEIAQNILKVKGIKGLRKTVTIPYAPDISPDGSILEVSHDWEALTTSVTYRTEGSIPDFLVAQSVSGIATFISARDISRLSGPKYGVVSEIKDNIITVNIGGSSVKCSTKLNNLGEGDNVLVSFPSGHKLRGQVIARL